MTPHGKYRIPHNTNPRTPLQSLEEKYRQAKLEYKKPAHGSVEGPEMVQTEGEFRGKEVCAEGCYV